MSRTVSLSTLISDVRFLGDAGGASIRHTDAQITRRINQSIQAFRRRISDEGSTHYLVSYSSTFGVGPTSPYPFYVLDLTSAPSPALVRTYGVDVTFSGGHVRTLDHVPFEQRAKYGTTQQGGEPLAWAHFKTAQVAILPAPDSAYTFVVWYLPVLADLSGADTFDGVTGWEDYIVADVVCELIARDQFPLAFQMAAAQRDKSWESVIRDATKVSQAGGAHVGRDSFGGKLTHFLGDRHPARVAVGGPAVPAPGSVTNAMLADMTGPTVKAVMSGTTRPQDVQVATLTTYLGLFNTTQRGLVPPPLGVGGLFLDDSGAWSAPAGGGGGGSVGPSGAVQYQAGTGMAGASGFRIHGNSPSLLVRLDGSFRLTGGSLDVGSGTTKVAASGIDAGAGSIVNVATLVGQDASFRSVLVGSGVTNANLAPMGSGTVKGNLSGTGSPSDIPIATFAAFLPTFTATIQGLAPASGGGTDNYLRADGTWGAPPGTVVSPGGTHSLSSAPGGSIQYITASGTFGGTTRGNLRVAENGANGIGIAWGSTAPTAAAIGWSSSTITRGITASGVAQTIFDWRTAGNAGGLATGAVIFYGNNSSAPTGDIESHAFRTQPSGTYHWQIGPSGLAHMRLQNTGLDARQFHVAAKSIAVTEGLESLTSALYQFTDTVQGVAPASGGGSTNYLRADGTWNSPPGGSASPGGGIGAVQFNNGVGGFGGGTGINIVASGVALGFGVPSFLPGAGDIRVASGFNITGNLPSGIAGVAARQSLLDWSGGGGSGTLKVGGASGVLGTLREEVATGGAFEWLIGGQTGAKLSQTGIDLSRFHVKAKSLDVSHINGLPADFAALKRFPEVITNVQTGVPSGLILYPPRGAASGGNRLIIPSGAVPAARTITVNPTGGKAGEVIRIERNGTENFAVTIALPTGTTLHVMPSGTKSWADFMFTKPSGVNFELAGHADMY